MDPAETFNAMMEAFGLGMHDEATEHANALAEWLNKDGFSPAFRISTAESAGNGFIVTDQLAREFCRAACRLVLDQHEAGCDPAP